MAVCGVLRAASALVVRNEAVRAPMAVRGRLTEFAIVVAVEQMFFHCAKCVVRSKLWQLGA